MFVRSLGLPVINAKSNIQKTNQIQNSALSFSAKLDEDIHEVCVKRLKELQTKGNKELTHDEKIEVLKIITSEINYGVDELQLTGFNKRGEKGELNSANFRFNFKQTHLFDWCHIEIQDCPHCNACKNVKGYSCVAIYLDANEGATFRIGNDDIMSNAKMIKAYEELLAALVGDSKLPDNEFDIRTHINRS